MSILIRKIVRRLDLMIYGRPSNKNRLKELIWAEVFGFAIRDSEWFTRQALTPGRWALGFPALYVLYRALGDAHPASILEFGLGESTKLTYQYHEHSGAGLTVIEQDAQWLEIFCKNWGDVGRVVKVLPLKTVRGIVSRHSYDGLMPVIEGCKYDLVIVDGPWGSRSNSRSQVLDVIEAGLLADDFVIIVDDAERRGERQTIKKLRALLNRKGIPFSHKCYRGEKEVCVLCSPSKNFLTTL